MTDDREPFREARAAGKAKHHEQRLTRTHVYLSTACLHSIHDHCNAKVNLEGDPKLPQTCKWCDAKCVCDCHKEAS